ncbi:MAG TPA: hypothetical protein VJ772_00840 [Nitrososphaeraceae archaeon]|nr:hypothetical protein [Nitrososphaeraceae archaeon]
MTGKLETSFITGKCRRKYQDKQGNKVNDPNIIAELKKDNTVTSYHSMKHGKDTFYDKQTRH